MHALRWMILLAPVALAACGQDRTIVVEPAPTAYATPPSSTTVVPPPQSTTVVTPPPANSVIVPGSPQVRVCPDDAVVC